MIRNILSILNSESASTWRSSLSESLVHMKGSYTSTDKGSWGHFRRQAIRIILVCSVAVFEGRLVYDLETIFGRGCYWIL
jgi:hypothetical protein